MVRDTAQPSAAGRRPLGPGQALDIAELRRVGPILLLIVTIQSLGALTNRTAFIDEATYVGGGRRLWEAILSGAEIPRYYENYFTGLPYFYALLGGIADAIGGLAAARLLSLSFMLVTTLAVYWLARHFSNPTAGLFAAALFAWQPGVFFISHLANHDGLCLMLLALSASLALNAARRTSRLAALPVGASLLLASLAKYVGALFVPTVLALLFLETWPRHGWRAALERTLLAFGLVGMGWLIVYALVGEGVSRGVAFNMTDHDVLMFEKREALLQTAMVQSGLMMALGLFGTLAVILLEPRAYRRWLLALVWATAGLLLPASHIYFQELNTLDRHLAYSSFFLAPVAGYAFGQLVASNSTGDASRRRWLLAAGTLVCLLQLQQGYTMSRSSFRNWADTTQLVRFLSGHLRPGMQVLTDANEILRYSFREQRGIQWTDLYAFEYQDSDGRALCGDEAYTAAILDGYFDYVVLEHNGRKSAIVIDRALAASPQYRLLSEIPYADTGRCGAYQIWQRQWQTAATDSPANESGRQDAGGFEEDFQELSGPPFYTYIDRSAFRPFSTGSP